MTRTCRRNPSSASSDWCRLAGTESGDEHADLVRFKSLLEDRNHRRWPPRRLALRSVRVPGTEVEDVGIAPHPGRESLEVGKRLHGRDLGDHTAHVAVHAIGVGPVGLGRHQGEPLTLDELPRDARALPVELVRAMGRSCRRSPGEVLGEPAAGQAYDFFEGARLFE
jgi:hypothetical protein